MRGVASASARPSRWTASISRSAPARCCALVGENGAGKSTLMKVLSGAHAPTRARCARRRAVPPPRPARRAPRRRRDDLPGAVARAAPLGDGEHRAGRRADALRPACDCARGCAHGGRGARAARPARHPARRAGRRRSPSAAQQLVEIARALARRLPRAGARRADEQPRARATSGGCSSSSAGSGRRGIAIVYISHFLEEVKAISDRFAVLRDGKSVGGGATADATPRRSSR